MFTSEQSKESLSEKKLKNLRKAHNHHVDIGHFIESGEHYSGFTFPDLMKLHHRGVPGHFPPRPVLEILRINYLNILSHPDIVRLMERYSKANFSEQALIDLLQGVGKVLGEEEVEIFGSNKLAMNAPETRAMKGGINLPLIMTEDLVRETSYKDSVTHTRRKVL